MRASGTMLLAAGPLALWGVWSLWAAISNRQWLAVLLGLAAVGTSVGLLRLAPWAKSLAYVFAVALPGAWLYAVWQLASRGWPYPDWRRTILVLVPGTLFVLVCVGGTWIVHRQYRRVAARP